MKPTNQELLLYRKDREGAVKSFMETRLLATNLEEEKVKALTKAFDRKGRNGKFEELWNNHLQLIKRIKSEAPINYPEMWRNITKEHIMGGNRHYALKFYIEGIIILGDRLFRPTSEKYYELLYDMATFYNHEHLEPPLNYEEFSQAAYEAEMRTNYLAALGDSDCACCLYRDDPAFERIAKEVANSDEMKEVNLLVYTNELFEKLESERCAKHAVDEIKPAILDYNNRKDRLSAPPVKNDKISTISSC
jgi:hypothetical protein